MQNPIEWLASRRQVKEVRKSLSDHLSPTSPIDDNEFGSGQSLYERPE